MKKKVCLVICVLFVLLIIVYFFLGKRQGDYTGSHDSIVNDDLAIPDYYFEKGYINNKVASIPEGKSFIFITDTHWPVNEKVSTSLITYVMKKADISKVVFGGDILTRDDTKEKAKATLAQYLEESIQAWGIDYLPVFGNHDLNMANATGNLDEMRLSWLDVESTFVGHLANTAQFERFDDLFPEFETTEEDIAELRAYTHLHYYCDDNDRGIRYIIINTGTPDNIIIERYFGVQNLSEMYLQMDWLYNTLMSTPQGYDVIVFGHEMNYNPQEESILGYHMKGIVGQLSALKMKTSTALYVSGAENELLDNWISRGNHIYDFSNAPEIGKILCVSGHNHIDYILNCSYTDESIESNNYTTYEIESGSTIQQSVGEVPIIHTQCDAYGAVDSVRCYDMTPGTITEQCFDVITLTEDGVACTRFGAGEDRFLEFR